MFSMKILKTLPADLLGLTGLIFFGKCARKLIELHQTKDAIAVLTILVIWVLLCVLVLRKQNRI